MYNISFSGTNIYKTNSKTLGFLDFSTYGFETDEGLLKYMLQESTGRPYIWIIKIKNIYWQQFKRWPWHTLQLIYTI